MESDDVPPAFCCPIGLEPMSDPVFLVAVSLLVPYLGNLIARFSKPAIKLHFPHVAEHEGNTHVSRGRETKEKCHSACSSDGTPVVRKIDWAHF